MSAAAQPELVTITINDVEIQVPKGELIVESVKRLGLEIPIFCYHPRMKPVGMCRMCLVEVGFKQPDGSVRKMPKPQAGCTLPADNNMVIYTDTEMVHRDRKGVLEFLLINHPLDCPICDRGGECPLQNNTIFYGPSTTRFTELKRHAHKAFPLSKYVTLDLERCIQCGRCVRFTEEISGDHQLAFRFRGSSMQPSTYQLTDFESKFSGNTIEICPVGALTSSKYRFRARPWDLETRPGVCLECSNHCNVHFDYRAGKFVRISGRTNEAVNEEWTCDKGKFGHDFYNAEKRQTRVVVREGRGFAAKSWAEAYDQILSRFVGGKDEVAALVGGRVANEGLYLLQKLFRGPFGSNNIDHRWTRSLIESESRIDRKMGVPEVQSTIASLEDEKSIVVFGSHLADELPIVFLRVRKAAVKNGTAIVAVTDSRDESDSFASSALKCRPGSEYALAAGMLNWAVQNGKATVPDAVKFAVKDHTVGSVCESSGVNHDDFLRACEQACGAAIVTSDSVLNLKHGPEIVEILAGLAMATGGKFNLYPSQPSAMGSDLLGVLPDRGANGATLKKPGKNTQQIIEAAANFELKSLWLVDCDPFDLHPDPKVVQHALEHVEFLVVQCSTENEACGYASVILPHCAPAEQEGTYTNCEGRVQRFRPVLPPLEDAKPAWRIFAELLLRTEASKPYFSSAEVFEALRKECPSLGKAEGDLSGEGLLAKLGALSATKGGRG